MIQLWPDEWFTGDDDLWNREEDGMYDDTDDDADIATVDGHAQTDRA